MTPLPEHVDRSCTAGLLAQRHPLVVRLLRRRHRNRLLAFSAITGVQLAGMLRRRSRCASCAIDRRELHAIGLLIWAERVGVEPTEGCPSSAFKAGALDHSTTSPKVLAGLSQRPRLIVRRSVPDSFGSHV